MCGIFGAFAKRGGVPEDVLWRGTNQLHHRGPDAQRIWVAPRNQGGLGHARLSIIDLLTGNQPISNETGKIHIVVNGEFYQYEEMRANLIKKGHTFKTKSDSETLVHLYEEYGTNCLEYLRGEYAFILWDELNQIIFAARDRFGIKPLYYSLHQSVLYLGSEIKSLLAAGIPARWDYEAVYQVQMDALFHPSRTLFENVHQIPPGHFLLATKGETKILPYWDVNYPMRDKNKKQSHHDESHNIQQVYDYLREAVKMRLRADVPVACYLSGGLDSSSIAALATSCLGKPIDLFTISFHQSEYDETSIARETAAHIGGVFHPVIVTPQKIADNFSDSVWHSETLTANTHSVARFILSRATRDAGFKVVLTGEGADEIFAGYNHLRRDMLLDNAEGLDSEKITTLLQQLQKSNPLYKGNLSNEKMIAELESVRKVLGYVPTFFETAYRVGKITSTVFTTDFYARFGQLDTFRLALDEIDVHRQLKGRDHVHQSLYLWLKFYLPGYILLAVDDHMDMAHAIEARVPYLDHKLTEFVNNIPSSVKIKNMTEKYILREAMRPMLTETVYNRQKHPFTGPPVSCEKERPLFVFVNDTLRSVAAKKVSFYDQKKVIALLDHIYSLDADKRWGYDTTLMKILSVCIMNERFKMEN